MKIQRTGGPLGRAFGFDLTIGRLSVSFNAGWYVLFINWRGFGYVHVSPVSELGCKLPWQVETCWKGDLQTRERIPHGLNAPTFPWCG